MTRDTARAIELFRAAVLLEGEERSRFLDERCGGDAALRAFVEDMLRNDADDEGAFGDRELAAHRARLESLADRAEGPAPHARSASGRAEPEHIGRYRVIERIGEGGMAVVYLAEQERPRRRVAVKVVRRSTLDARHLARFEHETQLLGRLAHPNIAAIHEAGTFDDGDGPRPFFAMEWVEGEDLLSWARAEGRARDATLRAFVDVCDAVHHAHEAGVVHRDLKPDNLLVTRAGTPKVLDFGVARAIEETARLTTMHTRAGQLIGTVAYMSPEQAGGDVSLDRRSDVYSLGVVLFELLAHRLPHATAGRPLHEAVRAIREDEPTRLGSVDTTLRGDLEVIVGRCLEKDRARRYASASELARDLERHLAHEPIRARPPTTLYQVRKFAQRNRGLTAGVALAFAGLIAALVVISRSALEEARHRREVEAVNYRMLVLSAADALSEGSFAEARQHLEDTPERLRGWEFDLLSRPETALWELDAPFSPPPKKVTALRFTPDGSRIVTFLDEGTLAVLDAGTGEVLHELRVPAPWAVQALAVSDTAVAVTTVGARLAVFDLATGERLVEQDLEPLVASEVEPPSDEGSLATRAIAWHGGELVVGLRRTGYTLSAAQASPAYVVALGPPGALRSLGPAEPTAPPADAWRTGVLLDGAVSHVVDPEAGRWWECPLPGSPFARDAERGLLLRGTFSTADVRLTRLDPATSEPLDEGVLTTHHSRRVDSIALAGSRGLAATAASDDLQLLDLATSSLVARVPTAGRTACAFDPAGDLLAVRDERGVRVLEVDGLRTTLLGHSSFVYRVEFTPDGRTIVSRDLSREIRLWDANDGRLLGVVPPADVPGLEPWASEMLQPLALSRDGAALSSRVVTLHEGVHRARPAVASLWAGRAFRGVADPRAPLEVRAVKQLGPRSAAAWARSTEDATSAWIVEFDPGGTVAHYDGAFWSRGGELLFRPPLDPRSTSHTASFSPDAGRAAVARDSGVHVYETGTWRPVAHLAPDDAALSVVWSPDGTRLAVGLRDGVIRLYGTASFELLARLAGHTDYVRDLAWSPDGTQLVSASGDRTLRVWDTRPWSERRARSRADAELRAALRPSVLAWLDELGSPLRVEARIRGDGALDADRRHAALRVLREEVEARADD